MTLTEFLLARIAEDEASTPGRWDDHWYDDPSRYAREAEAKRRIVEAWRRDLDEGVEQPEQLFATRCLALPYADHPDYREEWRP